MRKRLCSAFLALVMALGLLPASAFAAPGTETRTDAAGAKVSGGINGYEATVWTDPDTSSGYQDAFSGDAIPTSATGENTATTEGKTYSSALNGKIWADKSVNLYNSDSSNLSGNTADKFKIKLSALGQTYANWSTTQTEVGYDVMLVLDFSGSMNDRTGGQGSSRKAANMVAAVNTAMKALMDGENNRVGIVSYAGSTVKNDSITEFLPLDRYNTTAYDDRYLQYSYGDESGTIKSAQRQLTGNNLVSNSQGEVNVSGTVTGGTPTQGGIYKAMELLVDAAKSTTGVDKNVPRIPAIILLTDGQPGVAVKGYTDLTGTGYTGSAHRGDDDDDVGAYTILTANHAKKTVSKAYWNEYKSSYAKMTGLSEDTVARIYSIGFGIDDDSWTHFVLDPGMTGGSSDNTIKSMKDILGKDETYKTNYNYCTQYEGGTTLTEAKLTEIFQKFLEDIQDNGGIQIPTESVGSRDKITFFDDLGKNFRMATIEELPDDDNNEETPKPSPFKLTVPTLVENKTDQTVTAGATRVYSLELQNLNDSGDMKLVPTTVKVGNEAAKTLNPTDPYDKAAKDDMSITIKKISTGALRLQAEIPSKLMAYNVMVEKETNGTTRYSYTTSDPLALEYVVALEDDTKAGTYQTNEISQSSVQFVPSSAGEGGAEADQNMPYYWQYFEKVSQEKAKSPNATGTADYVYNAQKNNNLIQIYLGNNGKVDMKGKTLTFDLHWADQDNIDGKRFENIHVQLYRDAVNSTEPATPDASAAKAMKDKQEECKYGDQELLGLSNVLGNDSNTWQETFSNLPVYDSSGKYYRYWLKFVPQAGETDNRGYEAAIDGADKGMLFVVKDNPEDDSEQGEYWFCFETQKDSDGDSLKDDAQLCVELSRSRDMIDYTIEKKWDPEIPEAQRKPVQIQLFANGQMVNAEGEEVEELTPITISTDGDWTKKLSLPRYSNGEAISYTPVEQGDEFTPTVEYEVERAAPVSPATEGEITGYKVTLTNHASLTTTSLTAVKVWDDESDQAGDRPNEITLKLTGTVGGDTLEDEDLQTLIGSGTPIKQTLTDQKNVTSVENNSVTWSGLPKTSGQEQIIYSAVEDSTSDLPEGYESVPDDKTAPGYVFITNTYTPKQKTITLSKVWEDGYNRDNMRPSVATGKIWVYDGVEKKYSSKANYSIPADGTATVTLPLKANGKNIEYYLTEDAINTYNLDAVEGATQQENTEYYKINGAENVEVKLTNKHPIATEDYTMHFQWDDAGVPVSQRPTTVTVSLDDGNSGKYSVTLNVGEGGKFSVPEDLNLPNNVQVTGSADGMSITFTGLPSNKAKESGQEDSPAVELAYTAEATEPDGIYTVTKTNFNRYDNTFVYSATPEMVDLTLTKIWDDNKNNEHKRPSATTFVNEWLTITADDGTTFDKSGWTFDESQTADGKDQLIITFPSHAKYKADRAPVQYSVSETAGADYTGQETISNVPFTNNSATLTNKYTGKPATYDANIVVTKHWIDGGDSQDLRPDCPVGYVKGATVDPLNICLYNGSENTADQGLLPDMIAPGTVQNTWVYTWNAENLPMYLNGQKINYTAYENNVDPNYTATTREIYMKTSGGTMTGDLYNTLNTDAVKEGTLTINKVWQDNGYNPNHPQDLKFTIYGFIEGGGNATAYEVTMSGSATTVTKDKLPVMKDGKPVQYYVVEQDLSSYEPSYSSSKDNPVDLTGSENAATITVTNAYKPSSKTLSYDANGGQITTLPGKVTLAENVNETEVDPGKSVTQTTYPGATFLGWSLNYQHPVFTEEPKSEVTILKQGNTVNITNDSVLYAVWAKDENKNGVPDYNEESVTVTIVWKDSQNQDGLRPDQVTVTLARTDGKDLVLADGQKAEVPLDLKVDSDFEVVMGKDKDGNTTWSYTWDGLPSKDEGGNPIAYTVTETQFKVGHTDCTNCPQYTMSNPGTSANNYTIDNSRTPETVDYSVVKVWNYGDLDEENRPDDLKANIELWGNGQLTKVIENGSTVDAKVTLDQVNDTEKKWENLPKYDQGVLITYHAVEMSMEGGTANYYSVDHDWKSDPTKTTITNTYSEERNITLIYEWDDNNDTAGLRPDSLGIQLYDEDDIKFEEIKTIRADEDTGVWACSWTGLSPEKVYTAKVEVINGISVTGEISKETGLTEDYTFQAIAVDTSNNVLIMESTMDTKATVNVQKVWKDAENLYKLRPDNITVNVYRDGKAYSFLELTGEDDTWTGKLENLPAFKADGTRQESVYTVKEVNVPAGYTSTPDVNSTPGTTIITNSLDALDPANKLTVTYVYNNGQENGTESVAFGGKAINKPATWEGHKFVAWYSDKELTTQYNFEQEVTQDITLYAKWVSEHDGKEDPDDHHFLTFVYQNANATETDGTAIEAGPEHKMKVTCKDDFTFKAFADSGYILSSVSHDGTGIDMVVNGNAYTLKSITKDITVTIKATKQNSGGSGGSGGGTVTPPKLETGDHFAYVMGYPDEMVKPYNNITRAEVATIFFRLLTDEYREECYSTTNNFTDVSEGMWFNNAISTLSNAEIINGYQDGSFQPNKSITRAELAAIAARFDELTEGEARFTDISGHWAEELIESAYNKGWVGGYPDGTFRPDQAITRAEVMTLINRVLNRHVDQDGMLDDMITWPDNTPEMWFYEAVQEATNSHDYKRDKDETLETWTKINPPRDWSDLEN